MNIVDYYQKGVYPAPYKIVVIGDVHGDKKAFIHCLVKNKLVDKQLNWIGGKANVVQMGDVLDRQPRTTDENNDEDSEFKILNIIHKLQIQSFQSGGAYHCILGNHELMNVMGVMDYASPMGIHHFGGAKNRINAFKPGSNISCYLGTFWNPIIKIGNYIFAHGGVSKETSNYNIKDINLLMRTYLNGKKNLIHSNHFKKLFLNDNSLLWYRKYSARNKYNKQEIQDLKQYLSNMNAKNLVVGHTPQDEINSIHNGMIWRVDCGMSDAFGVKEDFDRVKTLVIIQNGKKTKII